MQQMMKVAKNANQPPVAMAAGSSTGGATNNNQLPGGSNIDSICKQHYS